MPYIADKQVWKAVQFAAAMIKQREPKALAIHKAAKYYDVSVAVVARELGKRGGAVSARSARRHA